jgi:hypothetical protein
VARGLRHEDPRCGRDNFDRRAGIEWDLVDNYYESFADPDVPWRQYKSTLEPANRILFCNEQWAVTIFNLEPIYSTEPERYEYCTIAAGDLLRPHDHTQVYYWPVKVAELPWAYFASFEEAFMKALHFHCRKRSIVIDHEALKRSFRRAHAIARGRRGPQKHTLSSIR